MGQVRHGSATTTRTKTPVHAAIGAGADDLARGEVFPGGLVRQLGKAADQLLEGEAHLMVRDAARVQRRLGEFLGHEVEQARLGQSVDLGIELEPVEDVANLRREAQDVAAEVQGDVVLIAHQRVQIQL